MQPLRDEEDATKKVNFGRTNTPSDLQQRFPQAVLEEYPELQNLEDIFLPRIEDHESYFTGAGGMLQGDEWQSSQITAESHTQKKDLRKTFQY